MNASIYAMNHSPASQEPATSDATAARIKAFDQSCEILRAAGIKPLGIIDFSWSWAKREQVINDSAAWVAFAGDFERPDPLATGRASCVKAHCPLVDEPEQSGREAAGFGQMGPF